MRPIHPFPARMAPDLAKEKLACFPRGSRILDPMCGSGTTLRHAINAGHNAVGWDIDPLAVKMSRTWCRRFDLNKLEEQTRILRERLEAQRTPSRLFPIFSRQNISPQIPHPGTFERTHKN